MPADLGDQLVERAEAEERTCREQEETPPRRSCDGARGRQGHAPMREDLDHAHHEDDWHEDLVGDPAGQRRHPGHGELGARSDLLQAVHEPVVLRVVDALQVGLRRQIIVAVVEETVGGQAVVGHVVVAVGHPIEAEEEKRPAGVEQIAQRDGDERRELPPGHDGPAPPPDHARRTRPDPASARGR